MSSKKKTIIGILTLALFIILCSFWFFYIYQGERTVQVAGNPGYEKDIMKGFVTMLVVMGIGILLSLGLLIYYMIDVTKNPKLQNSGTKKVMWIVALIFTGVLGMIVYFFAEIFPRKELPAIPNPNKTV